MCLFYFQCLLQRFQPYKNHFDKFTVASFVKGSSAVFKEVKLFCNKVHKECVVLVFSKLILTILT